MTQPLYIISACSISAQHTYDEASFLDPVVEYTDGKLFVVDPDYTKYISPVAIRRMSRLLKKGITAGMRCLDDAGVKTPDAIILGTSRGSVTDMEIFLKDVINLDGQTLNPTPFIQSTYNSVNGWLAMMSKCNGYNQAFVHRGFSLELCILDAQLFFAEATEKKYVLAGGFDELTHEYFSIRDKIDYYKKQIPRNLDLLKNYDTPGSISGEGAQFFTFSNDPANATCAIHSLQMLNKPTASEMLAAIDNMLHQNSLAYTDLDVIVSGMNGDNRTGFLVDALLNNTPAKTTIACFKHLSGEYDTASGFGLWLAHYLFKKQQVPAEVTYRQGTSSQIKNVLFCNVTIMGNVSLALLKSV
jgi:3-oxoacyl-[acyl-carrier-protein] synthase II